MTGQIVDVARATCLHASTFAKTDRQTVFRGRQQRPSAWRGRSFPVNPFECQLRIRSVLSGSPIIYTYHTFVLLKLVITTVYRIFNFEEENTPRILPYSLIHSFIPAVILFQKFVQSLFIRHLQKLLNRIQLHLSLIHI